LRLPSYLSPYKPIQSFARSDYAEQHVWTIRRGA